ncbi:Ig-like domain-containing protein [Treponema sp. OMZ 788]|uniref:Ig-like domain-containing protein n=1 Tax=Treponema sp. OMZ 788 TaxID=2563664 RepID=UPI0020A34AD5|nr:Ig-like domain-containing protein [Treponema sp. OMZ 788]UTC64750.1 Ig-like domain-containing protein [Treponema sp. OMZ 788]
MKKNKKYLRLLLLSLFTVITLLTCKPSLGGQVDILPPKGVITYPPTGENPIRGSFIIKGTASDDEEVTSVSVVFTNKETNATTRSFSGKLIPTGGGGVNWEIEINNDTDVYKDSRRLIKDYPIPDGEYEAKITITDKQGKPAFLDKTYKIDNTPPVFIVSRPSTIYDPAVGQAVEQYGSKLRIVGEAGDIHSLEKIGFSFPDEYASIKKIVKGNKESSVNIVMAEHENPETGSDYTALQAVQGNPVVNPVKGKLILSDDARVYDGSSTASEDFPGNRSEFYYIKNNIEKDVLSKGYTAKVIHDYFAGKKGNASGSEHEKLIYKLSQDTTALDALKNNRIFVSGENNTVKYTTFNLDPNKTPGFKIIGSSVVSSDISSVSGIPKVVYAQGSNLTVELYQNKDKISLLSNNTFQGIKDKKIKIVLYKGKGNTEEEQLASLKADNYTTNPEITKVVLFNASGDGDGPADVQFDPTNTEHQKGITIGEIIKIERQLPNGFRSGVYRIDITGKDAAGNDGFDPMLSDTERTGYASILKFELSAQAPIIYPDPIEKYQNGAVYIKAEIMNLDNSNGKVYYWLDDNTTNPPTMNDPTWVEPKYTATINMNDSMDEKEYKITIKAVNASTGKEASRELYFIFDKTKPNFPVLTRPAGSPTPTNPVELSEWSTMFTGTVSDLAIGSITKGSGISKVTWKAGEDTNEESNPSDAEARLTPPSGSSNDYTWEANVFFNNAENNYLHLWVYDGAGNISYKKFGPYTVKTDAPLIEAIKVTADTIVDYDLKEKMSLMLNDVNKKNVKLKITAKTQVDGRTIKSVKVRIGTGIPMPASVDGGIPVPKASGTWNLTIPADTFDTWTDEGTAQDIEIIVRDNPVPQKVSSFKGKFLLDKTKPAVGLISPANGAVVNNTVTIKGSSSDNREIAKLTITHDDGTSAGAPLTGVSGSSGDAESSTVFSGIKAYNWSFMLDTSGYSNGDLKLKAAVQDKAGNETVETFTLTVDNIVPNAAVLTAPDPASVPATGSTLFGESSFVFKGTASDQAIGSNARGSGISKVTYKVSPSGDPDPAPDGALSAELTEPASGNDYTWEANAYFASSNTQYALHVWVYDGAGNKTHTKFGTYEIDTLVPEITEIKASTTGTSGYDYADYDLKALTSIVLNDTAKNNVTLKIKAQSKSGIASVQVKVGDSASLIPASEAGGVWTASLGTALSGLTDEASPKDVKIIVKNKSTPQKEASFTAKFYLDKTPPSTMFIIPEANSVINKTVLFKGTASDNREIAKLTITKENGTALTGVSESTGDETTKTVFTGNKAYNWSFKLNTDGTEYTTGLFKLKAVAEDIYGNKAEELFTFKLDKTVPNFAVLTSPSVQPTISTPVELSEWSYTFKGTASDNPLNGISSKISKVTYEAGGAVIPSIPSDVQAKLTAPTGSGNDYVWEANVSFSNETDNYLHIWVYDEAGNSSYRSFGPYTVKTDAPLIEAVLVKIKDDSSYNHDLKADNSAVLGKSNKAKVKLEITAKTVLQGRSVSSVEVKVDSTTLTVTPPSSPPAANASGTWTADLSSLAELTGWNTNNGEKKVKIIVKDDSAKPKVSIFDAKFILDTDDPKVTFSSPHWDSGNPYTASGINKTVTISGSVSDTRAVKGIKIVKDDGSNTALTGVTGNTEFTVPDAYTWSFKLDTTQHHVNAGDLKLKAIVEDKAGNKTERPFTLKINQDADRPVIRVKSFTNIASASLTGSKTLTGTVTDDDGNPRKPIKVSINGGQYQNVNSSAGGALWSYTLADTVGDGTVSINFQIEDESGTVFTTGDTAALNRPKVLGDLDGDSDANDENISFTLDMSQPSFKSEGYKFALANTFTGPTANLSSNAVLGNTNSRKASFRVWAKDISGIKSVTLTMGSEQPKTGVRNTGADEAGYAAYDINNVSLSEGNPIIKIKVTDNANYENEVSVPVIIDFTAPVIEHQAPALDGVYFNEVNISGIITDTAPNNGIPSGVQTDTIEYKIANSAYGQHHDHGGQELSALDRTSSSWKVKIPDISKYKDVPGVTQSGSSYTLPVTIRAKDKAGNLSTEMTYNIKFDPNGGTPSISIATPKVDESIGGEVLISGSAAVANPASGKVVKKITLQLSLSPAESSFGNAWTLNAIDYGTGKEIASNNIGITYWNHTLTQAVREAILAGAETKDVYFRLKGVNNDDLEGDWTTPRKFVLSTNVPQFSEIKLGSNTYAPNDTWVKGDGSVITGKVKHNQGIKDDIHAASAPSLPAGTQSLDTSGTTPIPGLVPSTPSGLSFTDLPASEGKGYSFTVPIKTSHYQQKSGYIEFDITATDKRDQNFATVSSKILLKYDNSKPAAVFGRAVGKFKKAVFSASGAFGVSINLQGTETITDAVNRLKAHKDNLVLFAESVDGSAKAVGISDIAVDGSHARVTFTQAQTDVFAASALCILLEQKPVVFDSSAASEYQVQGFAYDTGSKTKSIAIKFGNTAAVIPNGENAQPKPLKIEPESGNFVSFTQAVKTSGLADGKHILKLTPTDDAGNVGSEYSCDVFVRNKPLKITNVSFSTDLNGSDSYSNDTTSGLIETVIRDGEASYLDEVKNYTQTLDIANDFTFKNAAKSQIKFALEGGQGTTRNFTLYKVAATSADPWALDTAVKSGSLTAGAIDFVPADFDAGQISDGDNRKFVIVLTDGAAGDPGRKLTLNVTLNVKTNDTRKPSVFMAPFYWNAENDNSLASNDRTKGHIEIKKVSTGAGESDVSGSVVLRGTSYHPTKLTKLTLTVAGVGKTANFGTGTWTSSDGLTVKDKRLDVNGHWVDWSYEWVTDTVGTKAVSIKAYHGDSVASGTADAVPANFGTAKTAQARTRQSLTLADGDTAVPGQFIRIVGKTGSADADASYLLTISAVNGSVVEWKGTLLPELPTAQGGGSAPEDMFKYYYLYPVGYAGDEPSFNKPAMSVNVVPYVTGIKTALSKLGGTNDPDLYARTATGRYPVQDKEKIEIQGFNLSGAAVTVGGVSSGTLTDTGSPWSLTLDAGAKSGALELTAGSGSNTVSAINNLTDNAKPYNKAKKTASNDKLTDDLYLDVWQLNSQAAKPHRGVITEPVMRINPSNGMIGFAFANGPDYFSMSDGTNNSYTRWHQNYDDFGYVDFVYDTAGNSHGVVAGRDINSNSQEAGKFTYLTSRWGIPELGTDNNYSGSNGLRMEALGQVNDMSGTTGGNILDKTRIQHPSLAAAKRNGSETRLYLAYYDSLNEQIRFKYGTLADTITSKTDFGHFADSASARTIQAYNQSKVGIVAGKYKTGDTGNTTGTYLSLGVVSGTDAANDTAVLIWFDETSRMLKYTYKTDPQNGSHASQSGNGSGNWKKPIDVFDKMNVGEYCKIAVDKAGGIHIAAFDSDTADLKYAYLSSYSDTAFKRSTVDSYGITGTHITLDVAYTAAGAAGKPVPYIGYYSASAGRSKLAYLVDTATGVSGSAQGTDSNGYFTGKWEVSVVPTASRVQQDNINVGIWKTSGGVIKDSKIVTSPGAQPSIGTSSSDKTNGTIYGNGTANPVLGYAIRQAMNGYIETAQKK